MINDKITKHRKNKSIEELKRKADKARRKGWFTVEEIDYAEVEAEYLVKLFGYNK